MAINLNFTGVKSGFDVIPAGRYYAKVVDSKAEMNKAGDALVVKLQWEVQDEYDANGEKVQGRKIFDNLSTKPAALFKLKGLLDMLGFDASGEFELDPEQLMSQELYLDVIVDNYQGQENNKVKAYVSPNAAE